MARLAFEDVSVRTLFHLQCEDDIKSMFSRMTKATIKQVLSVHFGSRFTNFDRSAKPKIIQRIFDEWVTLRGKLHDVENQAEDIINQNKPSNETINPSLKTSTNQMTRTTIFTTATPQSMAPLFVIQ